MWRIFFSAPCWIIYQVFVFLPLLAIGWIMIPLAAICGAYEKTDDNLGKPSDGPIYHFTWRIMHIWDNWEDGIANRNYLQFRSMFLQIVYWSAFRNPVNNLRITKPISCKINAQKVHFRGSFIGTNDTLIFNPEYRSLIEKYDTRIPQWFFCWQNIWHSNFYWQFNAFGKLWRFWIGNAKIYPTDIFGGPYGYRDPGAGPVAQFKRVKT